MKNCENQTLTYINIKLTQHQITTQYIFSLNSVQWGFTWHLTHMCLRENNCDISMAQEA